MGRSGYLYPPAGNLFIASAVIPLLLAWLLAYIMHPLVLILKGLKLPAWLAVSLSLLFYIGGTALVLTAMITRLVKELIVLLQTFNLHTDQWRDLLLSLSQNASIQNIINQINQFYRDNPDYHATIDSNISRTTETVGYAVTQVVTGFFNVILKLISALPSMGTILIVVVLAAFLLVLAGKDIMPNSQAGCQHRS